MYLFLYGGFDTIFSAIECRGTRSTEIPKKSHSLLWLRRTLSVSMT